MADPAARAPLGQGVEFLDANTDHKGRALPLPLVRQVVPLTGERIILAVTSDGENYVIADITGHTSVQDIRKRILSKLHIPDDLHSSFEIYRTELGGFAIGDALEDNQLLIDCQDFGDSKGTLKFLVQRTNALSESPTHRPVFTSGATMVPLHISDPSYHNHSCGTSKTDGAHEREMTPAPAEQRYEEEDKCLMAKQRANLVPERQQWAHVRTNANSSLADQSGVGTSGYMSTGGSRGHMSHDTLTAEAFSPNSAGAPSSTSTPNWPLPGAQPSVQQAPSHSATLTAHSQMYSHSQQQEEYSSRPPYPPQLSRNVPSGPPPGAMLPITPGREYITQANQLWSYEWPDDLHHKHNDDILGLTTDAEIFHKRQQPEYDPQQQQQERPLPAYNVLTPTPTPSTPTPTALPGPSRQVLSHRRGKASSKLTIHTPDSSLAAILEIGAATRMAPPNITKFNPVHIQRPQPLASITQLLMRAKASSKLTIHAPSSSLLAIPEMGFAIRTAPPNITKFNPAYIRGPQPPASIPRAPTGTSFSLQIRHLLDSVGIKQSQNIRNRRGQEKWQSEDELKALSVLPLPTAQALSSLEGYPTSIRRIHANNTATQTVAEYGPRAPTPPIRTEPVGLASQSQSIAPITNSQHAYTLPQPKLISRDFAAAQEDNQHDERNEALPIANLVAPLMGGSGVRQQKKFIKKVLERINAQKTQKSPVDSFTILRPDNMVPVLNIPRGQDTKMWSGQVEEAANVSGTIPEATFECQFIGQGSFGRLYHAVNSTTGEMIAVKQVEFPKTDSDSTDWRQTLAVDALKSECDMLLGLDHPHIVQYLGFEETITVFSLFIEYVPGGSIGSVLRKFGKFEDEVVRSFSHQIIDGLAYLHKSDILHRDLKCDSILVDRSGICKISGFSISKHSGIPNETRTRWLELLEHVYKGHEETMMQGSVFWAAPEMLYNDKQGYSAKMDIWSVGCIALEMQSGRRPWAEDDESAVMYKVGQLRQVPPVPDGVILGPLADDFRKRCFATDPAERPAATELLAHPWLQLPPGWVFKGFKGDLTLPTKMSIREMFEYLTHSGCPDLTRSVDPNEYSRSPIATGGFGDIFKGKLNDGAPVAIKVWRSRALDEELGKVGKRAMREIYNWSQLDHENVQKLLGVVLFDERLGMVSKWMERGNLQEYLQRNPSVDPYPLCMQVAQGVEYIHDKNMIHGDLKAINILVSSDHKLKLTDFDYSIMAESTVFSQTTRLGGGTVRWMAPELALDSEGNHQRNKRTDIYALGMTFLETISRAIPYFPQCKTDVNVLNALYTNQLPRRDPLFFGSDQRGDRMWALLVQCWDYKPAARPVAAEVIVLLQKVVRETKSERSA